MRIKELERLTGGLSNPSKMPGFAYGIPAQACKLGSILVAKSGSVCSGCYALKGMYRFPTVKDAQARRLETISDPLWTLWMAELIAKKLRKATGADRVFRWHDSGDIQDIDHLEKITLIAWALPDIRFWLPTRETKMVREYLKTGKEFPANLIVRVSATMVGAEAPAISGTVASTVASGTGYACPARSQGNECGACRACWEPTVASVDYAKH